MEIFEKNFFDWFLLKLNFIEILIVIDSLKFINNMEVEVKEELDEFYLDDFEEIGCFNCNGCLLMLLGEVLIVYNCFELLL